MDYTQIIQAVIALVATLISVYLIPLFKQRVSADKLA